MPPKRKSAGSRIKAAPAGRAKRRQAAGTKNAAPPVAGPNKRRKAEYHAFAGVGLDKEVALERAEHAATFRGTDVIQKGQLHNLTSVCVDAIGHHPDLILRHEDLWNILPNHLKYRVQNASKRFRGSELAPVLLAILFAWEDIDTLNLDDLPGVNNTLLHTIHNAVDLEALTSISIVNNTRVNSGAVASLLQNCINLSHLNLKGCVNLSNAAFPEKIVKQLLELAYVNVSFTQVGTPALTLLYSHCSKLATLKLAGCKIVDKNIPQIFTHPSDVLSNLKFRHCNVSMSSLKKVLENFPNLHTLDYSSTDLRNLRPLLDLVHLSQLRKLNISNCPELRPSSVDLSLLFTFNPDLEHIYLTKARISSIPPSTLANLKTLFSPEMYSPRDVLPEILEYAENLTYLDLSRTDLRFSPYDYDVSLVLNTPNLRILSLQDTHVSDESAELLSQLHSLRSLFLRGTAISTSGLRMIVYGCPWLEEVDLASCRRIDFRERRTVLANLQTEFQESLEEVRRTGQVMDPDGQIYKLQCVHNGDEERDALVLDIETRLH